MPRELSPYCWIEEYREQLERIWAETRKLFRQRRTADRALKYLRGVFCLGWTSRVSNVLRALGEVDRDWTAYYRLFSRERFDVDGARRHIVGEALSLWEGRKGPIVCAADDVPRYRTGRKSPGVHWAKAADTAPFRHGLKLAQRFLTFSILAPPNGEGYTRAIPLPWVPAFTRSSKRWPARKRTEALYEVLKQVSEQIGSRPMLLLLDGAYDVAEFWKKLPAGVYPMVRTARNRALYYLPERPEGKRRRGRPRTYGERAPAPWKWAQLRQGWRHVELKVRGWRGTLRARVEGPFLRSGAPNVVVFLIIVGGSSKRGRKRRRPAYFLVRAVWRGNRYVLPLPLDVLLFWYCQRWEVEVMHREVKTGLGLKHARNCSELGSVNIVRWISYGYATAVLAAYRAWGLKPPGGATVKWWLGAKRWTIQTVIDAFRQIFLGRLEFQPSCSSSGNDLGKIPQSKHALDNVVLAAGHL